MPRKTHVKTIAVERVSLRFSIAAALLVGARPEYAGKTIATFSPSAAERYHSSDLFSEPGKRG